MRSLSYIWKAHVGDLRNHDCNRPSLLRAMGLRPPELVSPKAEPVPYPVVKISGAHCQSRLSLFSNLRTSFDVSRIYFVEGKWTRPVATTEHHWDVRNTLQKLQKG